MCSFPIICFICKGTLNKGVLKCSLKNDLNLTHTVNKICVLNNNKKNLFCEFSFKVIIQSRNCHYFQHVLKLGYVQENNFIVLSDSSIVSSVQL